jgi:hypothetical protein
MPRTGWTPSIVPNGDDQNVYIVLDDFGRNGRAYRETDVERADLEAVIMDLLEGEYKNPVRSLASTPPRNGRRTYRLTLPTNCAAAAICKCATCRFISRISSSDTRGDITTSSCRYRCAWCEGALPSAQTAPWRYQSSLSWLHRASVGVVNRTGAEP